MFLWNPIPLNPEVLASLLARGSVTHYIARGPDGKVALGDRTVAALGALDDQQPDHELQSPRYEEKEPISSQERSKREVTISLGIAEYHGFSAASTEGWRLVLYGSVSLLKKKYWLLYWRVGVSLPVSLGVWMDIGIPYDTAVTALGALDDWWPVRASLSRETTEEMIS